MQIIAGPCSWENEQQINKTIEFLADNNIEYVRGGLWKYRSDPKTFQGMGYKAIEYLKKAKEKNNIKIVTEVFNIEQFILVKDFVDMIQIGSRNMLNTDLLKKINDQKYTGKILFKRHYAATLHEFINHARYLSNHEVIYCFRGIQSFFPEDNRFMPDLIDILNLKKLLPRAKICFDVSHSFGHSDYIDIAVNATIQFKIDYLMIEVHHNPSKALSDPNQQVNFKQFKKILNEIK